MDKKIMFDTLHYANLLKNSDVQKAEVQADALAQALCHNIYTKAEVDMRFEQALKRFDERTIQMREEMRAEFKETMKDFQQQHREMIIEIKIIEKELNRKITDTNIRMVELNEKTIHRITLNLGIIMTLLSVGTSFAHYFV